MIYFIQATESMRVKIGYTGGDAQARLATLQTGSPEPLQLVGTIPGDMEYEKSLHRRFGEFSLHGEWFNGGYPLMCEIKELLLPPYPTICGVEVKGVYLAGKISGSMWRDEIVCAFQNRGGWSNEVHGVQPQNGCLWETHPKCLPIPNGRNLDLTGPFWMPVDGSGGHGTLEQNTSVHACADGWYESSASPDRFGELPGDEFQCIFAPSELEETVRSRVARMSREAIGRADLIFAWIDRTDCHGTLVEIGYALGIGKLVVVAYSPFPGLSDRLWFPGNMASICLGGHPRAKAAWDRLFDGSLA